MSLFRHPRVERVSQQVLGKLRGRMRLHARFRPLVFLCGAEHSDRQHEPCLYGWKDGHAHTWTADRSQSTVLTCDRPSRNDAHPTMKPVELFSRLIHNSTSRGALVLDPFAGSGTTVIAAELLGRRAAVVEIDPAYCDVIVQRWQRFTGRMAAGWRGN